MQVVVRDKAMAKDPNPFGGKEHLHRYGIDTFEWPALPHVHQKVLKPLTIDNQDQNHFLGRAGHMTLAVYVQCPGGCAAPRKDGGIERKKIKSEDGANKGNNTMTHRRAKAHPR